MSESPSLDRRTLLRYGLGAATAATVGPGLLTACGSSGSTATSTTGASATTVGPAGGAALAKAARTEGRVVTAAVGVPDSYYAPVIAAFEHATDVKVDAQHPTYPAAAALADLAAAASGKQPAPYDVVELTPSTATQGARQKLLAPYLSSLWVDIPSVFKDAAGLWSAAYFGVVSLITDTTTTKGFAPTSWDELAHSPKTPKGSFAMLGDPRTGKPFEGGLGLLTVMSAAIANGGSPGNVEPGLALLKQLVETGVFTPTNQANLVALPDTAGEKDKSGKPVPAIDALYSFDLPLARHNGATRGATIVGNPPTDGRVVGFYPQAIAATARHSSAARLWIEFLQSDRGAEVFLANGALPTRHAAIAQSGSPAIRKALAAAKGLDAPVPLQSEIDAAQRTVDEKWATYLPTAD
ncbi:MAG: ABC transporter substrate-binding protein [Actinobacteria bacterium]|nr:ABC transporter substrate-binding protein [Actinomycetota bacterium]